MAEATKTQSLRSALKLTAAVAVGLLLTVMALAWPALAEGGTAPQITGVSVSSSKSGFFYSPLTNTGGTVYFNNLSGEGAGQIITVTVTISDDNPTRFDGGYAFGITPTTSISNPDGTWSVTYTIRVTDTSENGVVFTITDGDNLTDTIIITFTQDIADPAVAFTDVTDPQYDSAGDELDYDGSNWYRTSALTAGWSFTAAVTETGAGYDTGLARWDHQSNPADDQTLTPTFNGTDALTGTFANVHTNADGLVVASLVVTDRVGNRSSPVTVTLNLDGSSPVISSPAIIENSQYLYAVGNSGIYYGDDMTTTVPFTLTGSAGDGGVGLDRATFSPALGDTPPDDSDPSTWEGVYDADSSNTDEGTITVTVYDKVGNSITQTFVYTRDTQGPGTIFNFNHVPDSDSGNDGFDPDLYHEDDLTIEMSWLAPIDSGSGVAGYYLDVQSPPTSAPFQENGATGTVTGTVTVDHDADYRLYVMAMDNVGNLGSEGQFQFVTVSRTPPTGGRLDITEISGGEYLYIADATQITTGTLFYNNVATSSFRVAADASFPFSWGEGVFGWKVAFSPGWGESGMDEILYPSSEYTHTYTITPFETTDVFTVYYVNKAGNVLSIPINAELDTSGPAITFTGVTSPDWDADGDTSDYANYWYRPGGLTGGWSFTTTVVSEQAGVDPGVGRATWDHSLGTAYDQNQAAPGGDGTFTGVSGNPDGVVTVTVVLTDRVNNAGNVSMALNLDGTSPVITPTGWSESSDYLHILGGELFFSHMMPGAQTATVAGTAADNAGGSGLDHAAFSSEPNLAGSPADDTTPDNWSGDYSFTSSSTQGDGTVVVTVYDHVGNTVTTSFTYTEDATPPVVTINNVTDPGYDPDGDELNNTNNWYASADFDAGDNADGWAFYSGASDSQTGVRLITADWDHSNDADDQMGYNPGLDGDGVFGTDGGNSGQAVNDDADGVVTVTVRVEDNVGNVGSDSLVLRIDNTPPTITSGSWSESSDYLHADGATLYFSHQMGSAQSATLGGTASDGTGSGLDTMSFSSESNLAGSPGSDNTPANWSGNYSFDSSSSQGDGTVVVTLNDHLGHLVTGTYTYVLDITPPSTPGNFQITTPPVVPGYYNTQSLDLSWIASTDNITGSGLLGYYLDISNPPSGFYPSGTTSTSYDTGSDGVFTFYLMAQDNVANTSLTSTGPITVDTTGPLAAITATPEESERRFLVDWSATSDATTWPVSYDVQYRIDGGAWTDWLMGTTATSAYFGPDDPITVETDTPYQFRVRARDYVGNQGSWVVSPGGQLTQKYVYLPLLLKNNDPSIPFFCNPSDFEAGTFEGCWKTSGALPSSVVTNPVPPGGGSHAARLGSPSYGCGEDPVVPVGRATIQAYAAVPSSGTPYLRFDYRVYSYDTVRSSAGEWWDRLEVQVNGTPLARYGDPDPGNLSCGNRYDSGWQQGEFNLSAYKGQTILLTFFVENHYDGYWNTYAYLDNIRIEN